MPPDACRHACNLALRFWLPLGEQNNWPEEEQCCPFLVKRRTLLYFFGQAMLFPGQDTIIFLMIEFQQAPNWSLGLASCSLPPPSIFHTEEPFQSFENAYFITALLMITTRQRLSLGYRIHSRLCCTAHEAPMACSQPTAALRLRTWREERWDLRFPIHLCSPPPPPPASLPLLRLTPILHQKWTHCGNDPHSPLVCSYPQFASPAALCTPANPRPSLALGIDHTLVCLLVHFPPDCESRAGQLSLHLWAPLSGIGRH
uniref:Uncharacterized protein n=1 Tax=Molossus molossus TaxID=27622 RepID=A0A7J8J0X8_MOLMO|nr:hypothetical protein HJG59_010365 [Molossus molossus]